MFLTSPHCLGDPVVEPSGLGLGQPLPAPILAAGWLHLVCLLLSPGTGCLAYCGGGA